MSRNLRDFTKTIYTMDGVVRRVADRDWDNQSPNDDWTAKQTLGHVIWGMKRIAAAINGEATPEEQAEEDVAGDRPVDSWDDVRENLLDALDHHGVLQKEIETPFGDMTVDEAIGKFIFDALTHAWDIAEATGVDAAIPDDLAEKALNVLMAFGDAVRGPGLFNDAVEVDDDAPVQDRFIAFGGRKPSSPLKMND